MVMWLLRPLLPGKFQKLDLNYFIKEIDSNRILVAKVKTGMICYDYEKKKIVAIPEAGKQKLLS